MNKESICNQPQTFYYIKRLSALLSLVCFIKKEPKISRSNQEFFGVQLITTINN